jgi:hypothetical protein
MPLHSFTEELGNVLVSPRQALSRTDSAIKWEDSETNEINVESMRMPIPRRELGWFGFYQDNMRARKVEWRDFFRSSCCYLTGINLRLTDTVSHDTKKWKPAASTGTKNSNRYSACLSEYSSIQFSSLLFLWACWIGSLMTSYEINSDTKNNTHAHARAHTHKNTATCSNIRVT